MYDEITIMIPSRGRAGSQPSLHCLSKPLKSRTYLVVSEEDEWDYEESPVVDVPLLIHNEKGIANIRQWMIEQCETKYLFMIDDDMTFFRRIGDSVKLAHCDDWDIEELFETLYDWLESGKILTGVSLRQGNNHVEDKFKDVTRQGAFHGINIEQFNSHGFKFNKNELMEDFYLLLEMFTRGIPNRVSYEWCMNQSASNNPGGCGSYRTPELQTKCANILKDAFPEFVQTVVRNSKTGWKGMEERTDVRIQWKKAFESSLENM